MVIRQLLILSTLSAVLAACDGSVSSSTASPPSGSQVLIGTFYDSTVQGLAYRTASQNGVTDAKGQFTYRAGESITFSFAGVSLPAAPALSLMNPRMLFSSTGALADSNDNRVVNFSRLLQSVDADANPANGLDIREASAQLAPQVSGLNLSVEPDAFTDANPKVRDFVSQKGRVFTSADTAKAHLACSEQDVAAGRAPDGICDDGAPVLSANNLSIPEGNSSYSTSVTFTLSSASAAPTSFAYATQSGTATSGSDFVDAAGVITFPAGTTQQTLMLTILGDVSPESDEFFTIKLSQPNGMTLAQNTITVTLLDDDTVAAPVRISAQALSVNEGSGGGHTQAMLRIERQGGLDQAVSVRLVSHDEGSAQAGSDYVAIDLSVTIPAHSTSVLVPVQIVADDLVENNETFLIDLSSTNAQVQINGSPVRVTILNDDVVTALSQLSISDASVQEPVSGSAPLMVTVTRSGDLNSAASVRVQSADGSAKVGADYEMVDQRLSFPAGIASQSVTVTILADTVSEPTETFALRLSDANNADIADGEAIIRIFDQPPVATSPTISLADRSISEGNAARNETFTLQRTGDLSSPSSVQISVLSRADDTATPGADYETLSQLVSFPANASSAAIVVRILGDDVVEANETFSVLLSNAVNATLERTAARITIIDDDNAALPTVSLLPLAPVLEGSTGARVVNVIAQLSEASAQAITLTYALQDGTATSSGERRDFEPVPSAQVTIPAGATQAMLPITVRGDTFEERDETLTVRLINVAGAQLGTASQVVTIKNDEVARLLQVGAASRSVAPTDEQIAGVSEAYQGGMRNQKFHLGGYGLGPFNLVPGFGPLPAIVAGNDPVPLSNAPAGATCFSRELTATKRTELHCDDEITVRVMVVLDPKSSERVAFVTLDAIGAGNLIQDAMRAAVNQASCAAGACIMPRNVLFGQTHTHAGPDLQGLWGGVPREWINDKLLAGAKAATIDAITKALPAQLSMSRKTVQFNNYRRPKYRDEAKHHQTDKIATLLMAKADDAVPSSPKLIASMMQYSAHPTSVGAGEYKIPGGEGEVLRVPHPDYPLGSTRELETRFGGTALYFNGPIADASPGGSDVEAGGVRSDIIYDRVRARGKNLVDAALTSLSTSSVAIDPVLVARSAEAILPVTNPVFLAAGLAGQFNGYYQFSQLPFSDIPGMSQIPAQVIEAFEGQQNQLPQPAPVARTYVNRISLGTKGSTDALKNRLEIVTIPGEATGSFGRYIRGLAGDSADGEALKTQTMLLGLTQNSFGYIIPEDEFSYVDPAGDVVGYEETVSLGPMTAPLLRLQAYNPLFDIAPTDPRNLPPALTDCAIAWDFGACMLGVGFDRVMQLMGLSSSVGDLAETLADGCHEIAGPLSPACAVFDTLVQAFAAIPDVPAFPGGGGGEPSGPPSATAAELTLLPEILKAQAAGCDFIDPAACLLPFPNNHFTKVVASNETGRQLNINPLAPPRNIAGRPIDVSDQNRGDGFSPGQALLVRVPGLDLDKTATVRPVPRLGKPGAGQAANAVAQTMSNSLRANSAIIVWDVTAKKRHLVWAEIDNNRTRYTACDFPGPAQTLAELGDSAELADTIQAIRDGCNNAIKPAVDGVDSVDPTSDSGPSLMIRPGINFEEGHRYIVALRDLRNAAGDVIASTAGFSLCRDTPNSPLRSIPVVAQRCAELDDIFATLARDAGIDRQTLYSAWDFTVASERSLTGRLLAIRDATLKNKLPSFVITSVQDNAFVTGKDDCTMPSKTSTNTSTGNTENCTARVIKGKITVPNFIDKAQPPAEQASALPSIPGAPFSSSDVSSGTLDRQIAGRFYYGADKPAPGPYDVPKPFPLQPTVDVPFTCHIPRAAFSGSKDAGLNGVFDVRPSRVSLYGHGLFGSQGEIGQGQLRRFGNEHNFTFCALDWVGMAGIGDVANALVILLDMSNFPTLSDRVQQGILQFVAMGRLLKDPNGLVADPAFQAGDGRPLIDNRDVFYDGNSQGGIDGGVVVAVSPDIHRGALGVPGMNYSTLLQRSVDFDGYARVFYPAYPNTIDQQLTLGLVQMLWDRSENNGYAQHLGDGVSTVMLDGQPITLGEANHSLPGLDGQPLPQKSVLLTPAFGDHQVSMTTAEVMARTIGADTVDIYYQRSAKCGGDISFCAADRNAFLADRHPDTEPYYGLPLSMPSAAGYDAGTGSAMIVYDGGRTPTPPSDNTPPFAGADPHEYPRNTIEARCQKARFMRTDGAVIYSDLLDSPANCPLVNGQNQPFSGDADVLPPRGAGDPPIVAGDEPDYGTGLIGAVAKFMAALNNAFMALLSGDPAAAGEQFTAALNGLGESFASVLAGDDSLIAAGSSAAGGGEPSTMFERFMDGIGRFIGLQDDPITALTSIKPARQSEAVVLTGAQLPGWATPPAVGQGYPYPSGANLSDQSGGFAALNPLRDPLRVGEVRDAHNGMFIYPLMAPAQVPVLVPVEEVAAYKWNGSTFVEIPVQVDEKFTFFLANEASDFSFYSGTDPELTYAWDIERWNPVDDRDEINNNTKTNPNVCNAVYEDAKKDPVPGLDLDDEVVFMASDAGAMAPPGMAPPGVKKTQMVRLMDVADPAAERVVYLVQKAGGSAFKGQHYVNFTRNANADQWIDRTFFTAGDPEALGTSNTGYGQNLKGKVCPTGLPTSAKESDDRFARDGLVVTTDTYRWEATGRWMIRDIRIKAPGVDKPNWAAIKDSRPDLLDRWKGRAFQQSPDSTISVVGFEDEQVNWEANSVILGERCGPVRCMREVWGADSGTNVTKTETFYRDAVSYRYHIRVHPIPPDGLYTSWDYNRGAMIPTAAERANGVKGGRYYTVLRPQGVPVDGINDDIGQVDAIAPLPIVNQCITVDGPRPPDANGRCPLFLDVADATFNLPLAFSNWEQISGKGNSGSLVYTFQLTGLTSLANPLVVPFYRDDACFDDGTGDDPVARPFPGERSTDPRVVNGYKDINGDGTVSCDERQGVYAANGIHYFVTHDSDNAFSPTNTTEVDGTQWQIMVPTAQPKNVGDAYANTIRVPLIPLVMPMPGASAFP
ncbi:MAG: Calx-beta domain-containing protein [Paraperlucidibaca sp.]